MRGTRAGAYMYLGACVVCVCEYVSVTLCVYLCVFLPDIVDQQGSVHVPCWCC